MHFSLVSLRASLSHRGDRVRGLGGGDDSLGAGEQDRRLEHARLRQGPRLEEPLVDQGAHQRRAAVVTQAAGVDSRRDEAMAQSVHLDQAGSAPRCRRSRRRTGPWSSWGRRWARRR